MSEGIFIYTLGRQVLAVQLSAAVSGSAAEES